MTRIKVLSLQQPHALLFCMGAKLNETRSFRTHYRGTVYIHASMKFYFSDLDIVRENKHFKKFIKDPSDGCLVTGAIIGKVDIVNCLPTEAFTTDHKKASAPKSGLNYLSEQEKTFGNYSPGRFAWIAVNHKLFKNPILNVKGQLGIWDFVLPEAFNELEVALA